MKRIASVDIFRGMIIMLMITVDSLPDFSAENAYSLLLHTEWDGLSIADLAFPSFVFIMGVSLSLSMAKKIQQPNFLKIVLKRTGILILLGIIYNIMPALIAFAISPTFTAAQLYDSLITNVRFYGVLQRLGLAYLLASIIIYSTQNSQKLRLTAFSLMAASTLGYQLFNQSAPYEQVSNLSSFLDTSFLGTSHNYCNAAFDPEGLYGTLNTTATVILGINAGQILSNSKDNFNFKIKKLFQLAFICVFFGFIWSNTEIVSKPLWTAPFVLYAAAIDIFLLLIVYYLTENLPALCEKAFRPFKVYGMNSIFLYMLCGFTLSILWTITINDIPAFINLWHSSIFSEKNIQLTGALYAVSWNIFYWFIAEILYYKKLFIKV